MILVYKPQGSTPLQEIDSLRTKRRDLKNVVLSFAGRLDPMAEGLLLILEGDENKERKKFERLPKEYEFDVILGLETDSFDLLGVVSKVSVPEINVTVEKIPHMIKQCTGTFTQEYPPYSAARVNGKPLYAWARAGTLPEVMPSKVVSVDNLIYKGSAVITGMAVVNLAREKVTRVQGDFRQDIILAGWENALSRHKGNVFPVCTFQASVSGGTYIRSLAHAMGQLAGTGALASRIVRTRIGTFTKPTVRVV